METSQLHVHVGVSWVGKDPEIAIEFDPGHTQITLGDGTQPGLRHRLLDMTRPLIADLERLPEMAPREDDLSDDETF